MPTAAGLKRSGPGATTLAASPVPLSGTVCGEPVALSDTLRLAELAPIMVGVKLREMLQLEPAVRVAAHVLLTPKALALVPVTEILMPVTVALRVAGPTANAFGVS